MTIIPDKTAPALPCPPWCAVDHEHTVTISHQARRHIGDDPDIGFVALYQTDYGANKVLADLNGSLFIQVYWRATDKIVSHEMDKAEQLAETAEALGRPDVAALIRELAALAAEDGAEREEQQCPDHRPVLDMDAGWYCTACGAEAPPAAAAPGPAGGAK
jgi:hypothetical protein